MAEGPIYGADGRREAETGNEESMSQWEKTLSTTSQELKEESLKKGPVNSSKRHQGEETCPQETGHFTTIEGSDGGYSQFARNL